MNFDFGQWLNEKIIERLPLKREASSSCIKFRCPICGDSKKNLLKARGVYYLNTHTYYCFNCGVYLSGVKFLEALSGQGYEDLRQEYFRNFIKTSGGESGLSAMTLEGAGEEFSKSQVHLFDFDCPAVKEEWKNKLSKRAEEYLEKRLVLQAPFLDGNKFYSTYFSEDKAREMILIPWKMNGIESCFQFNDFLKLDKLGRKYIFAKGCDKLIYGIDNIDLSFPYIICFEGVYDSLFVKNGVAIGGKNLTDLQHAILKKRYPKHQIVLSFDNDKPGLTASEKAIDSNKFREDLKFFKWFSRDTKPKDVNDYILEKRDVNIFRNPEYVKSLIVSSAMMKIYLLDF